MIVISSHQTYLGLYLSDTRKRLYFLVSFVVGLGHVIREKKWSESLMGQSIYYWDEDFKRSLFAMVKGSIYRGSYFNSSVSEGDWTEFPAPSTMNMQTEWEINPYYRH